MNAIVPRIVRSHIPKIASILDYGSGPRAPHVIMLREYGFKNVKAWDIGKNYNKNDLFIDSISDITFDYVYASNVLNVQTSAKDVFSVIEEISHIATCGVFLNFPKSPNYSGLTFIEVESMLKKCFEHVQLCYRRTKLASNSYTGKKTYRISGYITTAYVEHYRNEGNIVKKVPNIWHCFNGIKPVL